MGDRINYEIMPDGVIKLTTDAVSAANHAAADELLDMIESMSGGERKTTTKLGKEHVAAMHSHSHGPGQQHHHHH